MPADELHPTDADALADLIPGVLARAASCRRLQLAAGGLLASLDRHGDVERQQYVTRALEHLGTAEMMLQAAVTMLEAAEAPPAVPVPVPPVPDPAEAVDRTPLPDAPHPPAEAHRPPRPADESPAAPRPVRPEGERTGGTYLDRQRAAQGPGLTAAGHAALMPAHTHSDEPPTTELVGLAALLRPDLHRP